MENKFFNDNQGQNKNARPQLDDDDRRRQEDVFQQNFRAAFESRRATEQQASAMERIGTALRKHWFKWTVLTLLLGFIVKKQYLGNVKITPTNGAKVEQNTTVEKQGNRITSTDNKPAAAAEVPTTPLSIVSDLLPQKSQSSVADMPTVDEATKMAYLRRFAQVAVGERRKYGIPASLILANALRQSAAGQRNLTTTLNNHFNLPCTFDWGGATASVGGTCFRHYENAWVSFRDHSVFLTSGKFAELHKLGNKDFRAWARGLQRLGYPSATPNLAVDLIQIVENYKLDQLDSIK